MRAVAVDRLDVFEARQGATGRWNVPESLEIFVSHFPRFPVVPGSVIVQALADLASAVVEEGDGPTWTLVGVQEVRFRRFVRPGDEVELSVEVVDDTEQRVTFRGRAAVDGRPVMTIRRLEFRGSRGGELDQPDREPPDPGTSPR